MNELIDTEAERVDIYGKLKDCFDFLASIVFEGRTSVDFRIRAVRVLAETAKILRLFLRDEEKFDELEKEVRELEKRMQKKEERFVRR